MTRRTTAPARYADGLENLLVPIGDLRPLPGNPRRGDVDAVARSLAEFGQRKPIVVRRETREVTAGNHTLLAAAKLGWGSVAVVWTDDDELRAKAFALADNRTHDLGGYDDAALRAMLGDVAVNAQLLAAASFSQEDLARLIAAATEEHATGIGPGSLLSLADVVFGEPRHVVALGDVWAFGPHRLVVTDLARGWPTWQPVLTALVNGEGDPVVFLPYLGLYAALVDRPLRICTVWDDHFIAGHLLDKWAAIRGDATVARVGAAA
jgi:hypothetical protein